MFEVPIISERALLQSAVERPLAACDDGSRGADTIYLRYAPMLHRLEKNPASAVGVFLWPSRFDRTGSHMIRYFAGNWRCGPVERGAWASQAGKVEGQNGCRRTRSASAWSARLSFISASATAPERSRGFPSSPSNLVQTARISAAL